MFWQTNIKWRKTCILKPLLDQKPKWYRIGFIHIWREEDSTGLFELIKTKCQICTKKVPGDRDVAVLRGDDDFLLFAVDQDGNQFPLQLLDEADKWDLPKKVILL
jgi:hypothetical protein